MKRIIFAVLLFLILIVSTYTQPTYAQNSKSECSIQKISEKQSAGDDDHIINSITLKIKGQQIPLTSNIEMTINPQGGDIRTIGEDTGDLFYKSNVPAKVTLERFEEDTLATVNTPFDRNGNTKGDHASDFNPGKYEFNLRTTGHQGEQGQNRDFLLCSLGSASLEIQKTSVDNKFCTITYLNTDFKPGTEVKIKAAFKKEFTEKPEDKMLVRIIQINGTENGSEIKRFTPTRSELEAAAGVSVGNDLIGENSYKVQIDGKYNTNCSDSFTVDQNGGHSGCNNDSECGGKYCTTGTDGKLGCYDYPGNKVSNPCQPKSGEAIPNSCNTAIGKIGINPEGFARSVLILVLSLSGGILIILFIANGFKLMTSQGDPKKIAEAREAIIAAVAGLLLIIFSLSILRLITVDILGLPGFS